MLNIHYSIPSRYSRQYSVNGHSSCCGFIGLQIFCPNCTIKSFSGSQRLHAKKSDPTTNILNDKRFIYYSLQNKLLEKIL